MNSVSCSKMSHQLLYHFLTLAAVMFVLLGTLCSWLFYQFYLRLEFNELGRYFDIENEVIHTDSNVVYGPIAGLFFIAGITTLLARRYFKPSKYI